MRGQDSPAVCHHTCYRPVGPAVPFAPLIFTWIWGYRTGGMTADGKDHLDPSITCDDAGLTVGETVMPCVSTSGQSVF